MKSTSAQVSTSVGQGSQENGIILYCLKLDLSTVKSEIVMTGPSFDVAFWRSPLLFRIFTYQRNLLPQRQKTEVHCRVHIFLEQAII